MLHEMTEHTKTDGLPQTLPDLPEAAASGAPLVLDKSRPRSERGRGVAQPIGLGVLAPRHPTSPPG